VEREERRGKEKKGQVFANMTVTLRFPGKQEIVSQSE
jgi:hypothetical protein